MNVRRLSRFLVVGLLSMTTTFSSAFAQTQPSRPKRITVQEMKSELDKMSQEQRREALAKAYLDADAVKKELAKAQAQLEFEKERSGGGVAIVASIPAILMLTSGYNAWITNELAGMYEEPTQKAFYARKSHIHSALFLGSTIAAVGILYAAKRDHEKQKELRLSQVEIVRAMDQLQTVQDLLEVEMARIDLLRNYYGVTVK